MKPFFKDIPNFWANLVDGPNKFWAILSQTISNHSDVSLTPTDGAEF